MIWTLENITFLVLLICAAFGALMALVNLVCEIVKMTPWYIRRYEKMTIAMAEKVIDEKYIKYTCPDCGYITQYSSYLEQYCGHCGHMITEEEKEKYETV